VAGGSQEVAVQGLRRHTAVLMLCLGVYPSSSMLVRYKVTAAVDFGVRASAEAIALRSATSDAFLYFLAPGGSTNSELSPACMSTSCFVHRLGKEHRLGFCGRDIYENTPWNKKGVGNHRVCIIRSF